MLLQDLIYNFETTIFKFFLQKCKRYENEKRRYFENNLRWNKRSGWWLFVIAMLTSKRGIKIEVLGGISRGRTSTGEKLSLCRAAQSQLCFARAIASKLTPPTVLSELSMFHSAGRQPTPPRREELGVFARLDESHSSRRYEYKMQHCAQG